MPSPLADARDRPNGFTLIEIIAVIILLGILAATVAPRYLTVLADARNSAAQQAVAEGIARVNAGAAVFVLANSAAPGSAAAFLASAQATTYCTAAAGDYTLAYTDGGGRVVTVTATGSGGNAVGSTGTGSAQLPQ